MSRPEKVFKVGAVRASIFRNTIQQQGRTITIPKVVLEVRYKDKGGKWKSTNSFSTNEVPKAILALQKTFDYVLEAKDGPNISPEQPAPISPEYQYQNPMQHGG